MDRVKSIYRINAKDIPPIGVAPPSQGAASTMSVKMVYGTDTGIMIAQRQQGYHSRPHYHDAEQFNYVLDGEIWFFIEEEGFRCVKGDIVRIPRNAVHWTWVRAEQGCAMLEAHTPSLTGDPALAKAGIAMVGPDEVPVQGVTNLWVDHKQAAEVERRAVEADPD